MSKQVLPKACNQPLPCIHGTRFVSLRYLMAFPVPLLSLEGKNKTCKPTITDTFDAYIIKGHAHEIMKVDQILFIQHLILCLYRSKIYEYRKLYTQILKHFCIQVILTFLNVYVEFYAHMNKFYTYILNSMHI